MLVGSRLWRGGSTKATSEPGPCIGKSVVSKWISAIAIAFPMLALALFGSMLHGQTPAAVQSVRFSVFSAQSIKDVAFMPAARGAPLKLAFQPTARSVRYEYRGAMPLRFVDAANGAVVAEANIPAGVQDALLLFSPAESGKATAGGLRYQIAVLDDGARRHAPGGLAIINLSGLALSGTINKEKVTLKPGLNPTISIGRSAKITLSTIFKNRTYQSYAATVTLGPKERALLILFPPFYKGGLEVQSRLLLDQPPASAPVVR